MPLGTYNGIGIIEATVTLPRAGRWSADIAIDIDSAQGLEGQPANIALGSKLSLVGTCRRAGTFAGSTTVEVVGGAAGLLRTILPKAFQECELSLPLNDVLASVGESLAPSSDAAATSLTLPKWIRIGGATAAEEIASLLTAAPAGTVARVLPDGTVWVGVDQFLDAGLTPADYQLLRDDSHRGLALIGIEEPTLLPGTLFLGRQVEEVKHILGKDEVRTLVQFASQESVTAEPSGSTHTEDLDQIILRRLRPTRFHRLCPATVAKQNGDGTLELVVDDTDVPGLSSVPIRTAGPGITLQVASGARCGVEFENGNPQAPVVTMFDASVGSFLSYTMNGPLVNIGAANPGDAAALASKVLAAIQALTTAFNNHTHPIAVTGVTVGSGTGTGSSSPPTPAPAPTSPASTNLLLQS